MPSSEPTTQNAPPTESQDCSPQADCDYILPSPKKVTKNSKIKVSTSAPKIPLNNCFEPLSEPETMEVDAPSASNEPEMSENPNTHKLLVKKPPPIIIQGRIEEHHDLYVKFLEKHTKEEFSFKYTKNNTSLYVNNLTDWNAIKKALEDKNVEFHSYSHAAEKTHAFVIKGLDGAPPTINVKNALRQNYKLYIKEVNQLNTKPRVLYLVVTPSNITLNNIKKINLLVNCRITWDRYKSNRTIIQCHRCQDFGHATGNCRRLARCQFCSGTYLSKDCTTMDQLMCANCDGPHKASSPECPVYIRRLSILQNRRNQAGNPPLLAQYVPAPPPTQNAWHHRPTAPPFETQSSPHTSSIATRILAHI